MADKLVSVIVPVYNVESYLRKCLDSIVGQTYHDLEIILVDDGSTDKSGDICDEYAKNDSRIIVIHKENGGLSDARNAGMRIATGEYVGFVDSDDWIELDMYEILYQLCEQYQLDLVAARFCLNENGIDVNNCVTNKFVEMTGKELLECNIFECDSKVVTNSVWDRLYRRTLIQGIEFPKGRKYEDICFTTNVFLKAERCGYLDKELYHYTVRDDSIMGKSKLNQKGLPIEIFHDLLPLLKEKAEILYQADETILADGALYNYVYRCQEYYADLFGKKECSEQIKLLRREICSNRQRIKKICCQRYSRIKEFSLYMVFYKPEIYVLLKKMRKAIVK